jgi:hypothetical protein
MDNSQSMKTFTAEENARDAAKWRALQEGVRRCLDDSSNGFTSIWGGEDNLYASVLWQSRGSSGMEMRLTWSADNNVRENLDSAVKPDTAAS